MSDLFGLQREAKIKRSGVREIFTPHKPIQTLELFFGREREVQSLIENLSTPGQHSLLFGDRGVGKSSLANIATDLLLRQLIKGELIVKRCDSTDNFRSIVEKPLIEVGVDLFIMEREERHTRGGGAGLAIPGIKADINSNRSSATKSAGVAANADSPSWVAEKLSRLQGLYLIDEVDALRNKQDRTKLAELIKQLSDVGSPLKILLVGIAETGNELTAGHPSVDRCLKETRLSRMSETELRSIIDKGESRLGLKFSTQAKERIVKVSAGYPHFAHLLALKAAEDAIAGDYSDINVTHVDQATRRAVDDAEGSLRRQYDTAARSYGTVEYKNILFAAALCGREEFSAKELRKSYEEYHGREIKQSSLNNYFNRLVSDGDGTILRRIAKGVYRFNDPRMPSYIRMAALADQATESENSSLK